MKRVLIFVVALPFLTALACLIANLRPANSWDKPLPTPNGYDKFVEAAGMVKGEAESCSTMSKPELAALIATNSEALALLHSAFTCECRVPIRNIHAHFQNQDYIWNGTRNLAILLIAEGRLAEMENHPAEAARDYLEVIHFGIESGRGGLMLDAMNGVKTEGFAHFPLEKLLKELDADTCRATASTLETFASSRENFEDIYDRERIFDRPEKYFKWSVSFIIYKIKHFTEERQRDAELKRSMADIFYESQFAATVLEVKFAARAYELDRGKSPMSIKELVPAYLKSLPRDPSTGKEMEYPFR